MIRRYRIVFRSITLKALAAALLLGTTVAQGQQEGPLGRLFFTPERRAVLERQRQLNIQEKTQETVEVANLHVNGVVRRGSNKTTVWINGTPHAVDGPITNIQAVPAPGEVDRIAIRVGEEDPASLRVGQKLNRTTQETTDGLAGGQIKVNRGHDTKPRHQ